ncbi:MAG: peroxiredoxin [Bdellovibrionota bacterium]
MKGSKLSENKCLKVGDKVPDFILYDQDFNYFHLFKALKEKTIVLFFYPKDYSPICTLEAIAFRDAYEDFVNAGAEVVGISADKPLSHRSFCSRLNLPFCLLVDSDYKVKRSFHCESLVDRYMGRVTYVIDELGIVRDICKSLFVAKRHMVQALAAVKKIAQQKQLNEVEKIHKLIVGADVECIDSIGHYDLDGVSYASNEDKVIIASNA